MALFSRSLLSRPNQAFPSILARSFSYLPTSISVRSSTPFLSSLLHRLRPLAAASVELRLRLAASPSARSFSTRSTSSSLNDPNPNWSNRPPKETILLDGCDFEHWLVVMEKPEGDPTRDEIIDSYIKTLAKVVGSEEEARMKIYSVSTRHYFAFGALVPEDVSIKIKELPGVRWVLPDSYLDVRNKDYGGEPFINGQAVPYDPKYHEEWVRNNARANERNRRSDRPRNFDRSRNFERRRENMSSNQGGPPPNQGFQSGPPPNNMAGPPQNRGPLPPPPQGGPPPQYNQGGSPPQFNQGGPPPQFNQGGPPPQFNHGGPPPQFNQGGPPPQFNQGGPPPQFNRGGPPPYNQGGSPQYNQPRPPPYSQGGAPQYNQGVPPPYSQGWAPQGGPPPPPPQYHQGGPPPPPPQNMDQGPLDSQNQNYSPSRDATTVPTGNPYSSS